MSARWERVFDAPRSLTGKRFHYCPGCGHAVLHRLVAEVIDALGIRDRCVGVPPAGCAVLAYDYFDVDMGEAPHGRALDVAAGIKRVLPDHVVFTYQGDGDFAGIGTASAVHAANRGDLLTALFVNNATYGMTGGQMAPTTLPGQASTTTPGGRDVARDGAPLDLSAMLALAAGAVYVTRVALTTPREIRRAKKAIRKAFRVQMEGLGFALVEVLSTCPTNWRMSPVDACRFIEESLSRHYPLGVLKDETGLDDRGER
jgi:2-oxoglutarate/2-oxoacid ferredoxin oxidoreductase subunit beta